MVEVFTIGGGDYLVNVFNAVAAWTGGGGYKSLIKVAMVIGLIYSMCALAFTRNITAWLNWYLSSAAIYMCLMVPTVTVKVTDRINPNLQAATIANVPLGLGVMASFTSRLGDWLTVNAETVFHQPEELQYNKTGLIFGARLLESVRTMQIRDPRVAGNVQTYFKSCVFPQVMLGQVSLWNVAGERDMWQAMGPGAKALSMPYVDVLGWDPLAMGKRSVVTCEEAYKLLDNDFRNIINVDNVPWGEEILAGYAGSETGSQMDFWEKYLPPALGKLFSYQTLNTPSTLRQGMLINAFLQARDGMGAGASGGALDSFAATRSQVQAENTYNSIAQQAMTWVPLLSIVLTCVFYAMFPVIFPLFLLPQTGVQTLKGYVAGFFYLASWGPMYVIIHMIAMSRYMDVTDQLRNLTVTRYNALGTAYTDASTIAGYMLMSVPFLAAGLAKGALSIGGQATSILAPAQNAAEAAALEQTTGNYSYGNTSFANSSANMHQSNQWSDAPTYMTGASAFTRRTDNGTNVSTYGDGNEVYNMSNAISNTAFSPSMSQGAIATESRQASTAARVADGYEEASRREVQHLQALRNSHSQTNETSHGFDSSSGVRGGSSTEQSDRRGITDRAGVEDRNSVSDGTRHEQSRGSNTNYSDQYSGGLNVGASLGAKLGLGGGRGTGAGADAGASVSGNVGWTRAYLKADTTSDLASNHNSRDRSTSASSGISEEHGTSASSSINDGTFYQQGSFSRSQNSEAFTKAEEESLSKIQSYNESARHYRELSRSLEQHASFAETNGFNLSTDLRQDLANFYSQQERDNPGANLPALYATSVSPTQEIARNAVISKWSTERQNAVEQDIQAALSDPALSNMNVPGVTSEQSVSARYSGGEALHSPLPIQADRPNRTQQEGVIVEGAQDLIGEQHRRNNDSNSQLRNPK